MKPKLRALQPSLIQHEGNSYVVLNDPLRLAEETVAIPQSLIPLLELCNGTRDLAALRISFELRTGFSLDEEIVEQVISRLDECLLLDSERFAQVQASLISEFREAPARPPALAGSSYPADPNELKSLLEGYLNNITENICGGDNPDDFRGIISPHIDFQRGGQVYAQVWSKAAQTVQNTDLAIIFGTNHLGGYNLFTLTRQNYSTPWGILPTATDIVDRLAHALGGGIAFADELYHRNEHSIELALIWLHYFLGERKCNLVPILCGSFERFVNGDANPLYDTEISAVVDCLQEVAKSRRTLVVAAGDLAHMGPAFGDQLPIDGIGRAKIGNADELLIRSMCAGNAQDFFYQIKLEGDRRHICGLAPIYLTLRVLGETHGEVCGYEQCPADEVNGSVVSICGVGLR